MALAKKSAPQTARAGKSFWTPGRGLLTLVVVGLISALGISSCNSGEVTTNAPPANAPPANSIAKNPLPPTVPPAPAAINLPQSLRDKQMKTLEGESLKLADYANKVLIVNIWATWCGPCRLEMPELVKMNNDYKSRGLVVLGLATTYNEHNDDPLQDYLGRWHVGAAAGATGTGQIGNSAELCYLARWPHPEALPGIRSKSNGG
jgi:thiol-disulfide isomerase/thioredoxin